MVQKFPAGQETDRIGNFWVDLTRSVVYILLPLSIVFTVILMSQEVGQSFSSYVDYASIPLTVDLNGVPT